MPNILFTTDALAAIPVRLVRLRWLLLGGELLAVAGVPLWLDIPLPWPLLCALLAVLAGFNALAGGRLKSAAGGDVDAQAVQLAVDLTIDLVGLGVMLSLTGGAANPFVSLLLLPVAAAALALPGRQAAALAVLAIAIYSLLSFWFVPLQIADAARAARLHLAGMWLTFVFSVILIAWLIVRMTASIRERDAALAAAREQALRDERVVAMGTLAAGAAHELGTPLGTMAVIVGELAREPGLPEAMCADLELMRRQIDACKAIVTGLAARAGVTRAERVLGIDRWLDELLARWRATRPQATSILHVDTDGMAPCLVIDATLEQAVLNLLNNASTASSQPVEVGLAWDQARCRISVADRGEGFTPHQLRHAGREALVSTTGGSGVGLMLSRSAIERLGGTLTLTNRPEGGALARIELPLAAKDLT